MTEKYARHDVELLQIINDGHSGSNEDKRKMERLKLAVYGIGAVGSSPVRPAINSIINQVFSILLCKVYHCPQSVPNSC
jgi:hypothetical protein